MDFLPKNYELPVKPSGYMKFEKGDSRFRVLGSAITGYEFWTDTAEGGRKPLRFKMDQKFTEADLQGAKLEEGKHFWAFPVWNYATESVQILELTQSTIHRAITALVKNDKWGDPKEYDIVVTKTGEKLDTEYQVTPNPKEALPEHIKALYKDTYINLEALYAGGNPFEEKVDAESVKV
jgi:hypothetical protein